MEPQYEIVWTDYMRYRARLRGFDLAQVELLIRYANERYLYTATGRFVVIGSIQEDLVMIPFDTEPGRITPVTIHATTRQQVNFRFRTGRFINA